MEAGSPKTLRNSNSRKPVSWTSQHWNPAIESQVWRAISLDVLRPPLSLRVYGKDREGLDCTEAEAASQAVAA